MGFQLDIDPRKFDQVRCFRLNFSSLYQSRRHIQVWQVVQMNTVFIVFYALSF